jgi:hypothetical protein
MDLIFNIDLYLLKEIIKVNNIKKEKSKDANRVLGISST